MPTVDGLRLIPGSTCGNTARSDTRGQGGSEPAQLALVLLADWLGKTAIEWANLPTQPLTLKRLDSIGIGGIIRGKVARASLHAASFLREQHIQSRKSPPAIPSSRPPFARAPVSLQTKCSFSANGFRFTSFSSCRMRTASPSPRRNKITIK